MEPKYSPPELQVMEEFWKHPRLSIREIQESFPKKNRPPYTSIQTIVYRPIKEDATRVGALIAGDIDLALDIPPELAPTVTASGRAKVKTVSSPDASGRYTFTMSCAHLSVGTHRARAAVSFESGVTPTQRTIVLANETSSGVKKSGWREAIIIIPRTVPPTSSGTPSTT